MKIVVVGAGRIGALHAQTLSELPGVEVEIADSDEGRAEALASALGGRSVELDSLWSREPDGVVISSPSHTHATLVEKALDREVAAFCEKPLTTELAHSIAISDRSNSSGVPVMVGLQRRFDPSYRALRAEFATQRYGADYLLRIRHSDAGLPPSGYLAASGSLFVDMCIHDFDAVRWVTGSEVVAVAANGMRLTGDPEVAAHGDVDSAVSVLELANGSLAIVEAFRKSPIGYAADAEVITDTAVGGTEPRGRRAADWMERFAAAFKGQIEGFVAMLDGAKSEGATALEATRDLELALAAERAAKERRRVLVEEVGG